MLAGEGKESKCLYLVGRVPKDRLNTIAERLKKLRFVEINVLKYQNKRSYQLLVDKMLSVGVVEQALRDKFKIEYIETLKTMQKTIII